MGKTLEPRVSKATSNSIARLARLKPGNEKMLSIYFDLDPDTFATPKARESQIHSLLHEAESRIDELDSDERKRLREDLETVRDFLTSETDWAKGAQALAIFLSSEKQTFEVLKLPDTVASRVEIEITPFLEPLTSSVKPGKWCVALVNRRAGRIFLGSPTWLREETEVEDPVHGQHDQGGWSQANYQRSVEESVADHLAHVAEVLMDMRKQRAYDRLVIGIAPELWPDLEGKLHQDVLRTLIGTTTLDVENSSINDVERELQEVFLIEDEKQERALLDRLHQELGRKALAAAGLADVLDAVVAARVETLLVEDGFEASGLACVTCDWIGLSGTTCPVDGGELETGINVVDRAIELTVSKSGDVRVVRYLDDLRELGSIAALLRF